MTNIYDQTYEMELIDLQDMLVDIQNTLISNYNIKEEIWRYHPGNENFTNPIKEYDDISSQIDKIEKEISGIELDIINLISQMDQSVVLPLYLRCLRKIPVLVFCMKSLITLKAQ